MIRGISEKAIDDFLDYLFSISHSRLLTSGLVRNLNRMDARLMAAGKVGAV